MEFLFLRKHNLLKSFNFRPSEAQILLLSGLVVGIGAGFGAVVFRYLINWCKFFFFNILLPFLQTKTGAVSVVFIPAIGGLIFGPIIYFFAREAKGHGVPEVMLAVAREGGKIRPVVAAVKSLASAICIGSGGSVGREGPIVQIGSALGSTWGQMFKMSESRVKLLVACGAAGGIAATFNAPIAGVFFALEIILNEFSTRAFGVVVLASVTSSVIGRMAFGNVPAFPLPQYKMISALDLPFYAILGICGAVGGIFFTKVLYWFEDQFDKIKIPEYIKPVFGGLLLGAVGLYLPQVFGVGYPAMSEALVGHYAMGLLFILAAAKILAVSLTIGSGGSGGVFAPSLFVGTMFGEAFGTALKNIFPTLVHHPDNFGLVGMAAFFAGAARAPITAIIILFELTGDYSVILPLMFAVVIATFFSELLSKDTIYTLKLKRRGIDVYAEKGELMRRLQVGQAMATKLFSLGENTTVAQALKKIPKETEGVLVESKSGGLIGVVNMRQLEEAVINHNGNIKLKSIIDAKPNSIFEDASLEEAIRQMGSSDQKLLPVVAHKNKDLPIGVVDRDNIFQTYSLALLKSSQ